MMALLLFLALSSSGATPRKWDSARGIVDRHEFYKNDEVLSTPQNSWQYLFALTFLDENFSLSKDCVFYRIPGEAPGVLKVKSVAEGQDCNAVILAPGDVEVSGITSLSFETQENSAVLRFSSPAGTQEWSSTLHKDWKRPQPRMLLSSAEFRAPRVIYLTPATSGEKRLRPLRDGTICHDVNSDCTQKAPQSCGECEHGWTEIPNGCRSGPKVCGSVICGLKGAPACRRGLDWQRKEVSPDCRTNASFAWCARGLVISCEGDRALCR